MKNARSLFVALCFIALASSGFFLAEPALAQGPSAPIYISPRPGARFVPPETTIAIRYGKIIAKDSLANSLFQVSRSKSNDHAGTVVLADDQRTIIFKPSHPFALGEEVRVNVRSARSTAGVSLGLASFGFSVSPENSNQQFDNTSQIEDYPSPTSSQPRFSTPKSPGYLTIPSDYPVMTITTPATGTAEGNIFLAPFNATSTYLLILENSGEPVYYQRLSVGTYTDFQVQPNGWLTYFSGGRFYAMDNTYTIVDSFFPGNGYTFMDRHDLQLLNNGHALILADHSQKVDMSQIVAGGSPTATVQEEIIQELDSAKNVVFEWRGLDHFLVTDTVVSTTTQIIDFQHTNAVELDQDGNLLISSRNMDEITKIDRQTGDILWRLGGKNNQFSFVDDPAPHFHFQHDIRRLPNGDVTLFDNNGNNPSKGLEYQLDEVNKIATHIWEYAHTPDINAFVMGNVQRLANGNTMIDWGSADMLTEVKPDGSKAFEIALAPRINYRGFRFAWHGYPAAPPTLISQVANAVVTLTVSWNGATDIASYRVVGGNHAAPTTPIKTVPRTGFETTTTVSLNSFPYPYFRVMPIDGLGADTTYSNDIQAFIYFFPFFGN